MRGFALICSFLVSLSAWANVLDVSLTGRTRAGEEFPSLQVHIQGRIVGFWLKLDRNDGKKVSVKGGGAPGVTRRIELPQEEGAFSYQGELTAELPDGTRSAMPLSFETQMYGPLRMTLDKTDVDMENRRIRFTLSRPAGKARVEVLLDTGDLAFDEEVMFHAEPAQTPLEVTWPKKPGRVMKVSITAYDTLTYFAGVEVFPWQIDIPHEEVHFDTGAWVIRPSEHGKLSNSLSEIMQAVEKYGHLAKVKLYILGHTDTVGTQASNLNLSHQRARSIGLWLKKKGLSVPVFVEGFGEDALRVVTPDETDEARNRRAEYILSVEPPQLAKAPFSPSWKKL